MGALYIWALSPHLSPGLAEHRPSRGSTGDGPLGGL